jgi:hypothetical protein
MAWLAWLGWWAGAGSVLVMVSRLRMDWDSVCVCSWGYGRVGTGEGWWVRTERPLFRWDGARAWLRGWVGWVGGARDLVVRVR